MKTAWLCGFLCLALPLDAKDLLIRPTDAFEVKMQEAEDGDVVYLAPGTHANNQYACPNVSVTFTKLPGAEVPNLPAPFTFNHPQGEAKTLQFLGVAFTTSVTINSPLSTVTVQDSTFGTTTITCEQLSILNSTVGNGGAFNIYNSDIVVRDSQIGNMTYRCDRLELTDVTAGNVTIEANSSSLTRVNSGAISVHNPAASETNGYTDAKVCRMESVQCDDFRTDVAKTAIFDSHLRKSGGGGAINFNGDEVVCMYSILSSDWIDIRGNNVVALFHNDIRGATRFNGPTRYLAGNNTYLIRHYAWANLHVRNYLHKMEIINNTFTWAHDNHDNMRVFWEVEESYKMERVYFANNLITRGAMHDAAHFAQNDAFVRNSVSGDGNYNNRRSYQQGGLIISRTGETNPGSSNPYFLNSDGTVSEAGAGGGGPFYFGEAYQPGKTYVITTYLDKTSVIKPFDTEVEAEFIVVR